MAFTPPKRIDVETVPVYHEKFKNVIDKIRGILKDYQHELKITQLENGGVTTSVEVTITLNK
jgi:hypothetical protein